MENVRQRLEAYRASKKEADDCTIWKEIVEEKSIKRILEGESKQSIVSKFVTIDFLDWPNRQFQQFYQKHSKLSKAGLLFIYSTLQFFAYTTGFGAVFLIFAILVALFMSLGQKKEGEISAYSVFNPNCERLPGQMTAEHFERDVIRRGL